MAYVIGFGIGVVVTGVLAFVFSPKIASLESIVVGQFAAVHQKLDALVAAVRK